MQNANDAVRNKHLEALADAAKNFTLAELASITVSGGASYVNASASQAGLMSADDKIKLDSLTNYDLPTASSSIKGGIKAGTGFSISGDSAYVTLVAGSNVSVDGNQVGISLPGDSNNFLRADGSWAAPPNTTYSVATTSQNGLMSYSDKSKLNGIASNANYYTLPTASTTTKGGIKPGTGLSMSGDTLNCTVSGGETYSNATSLQAGLMSAEDKQHLDSVFLSSADFADAVLTGVGGLFVPSVSSVSEFLQFKDSNIQFFDNRLKKVIDGSSKTYTPVSDSSYRGGNTYVELQYGYVSTGTSFSLVGSNNTVTLLSNTSTRDVTYDQNTAFKLSETVGFVVQSIDTIKSNSNYDSTASFLSFKVPSTGSIATVSSVSVCPAASTTASVNGSNAFKYVASIFDPSHFLVLNYVYSESTLGGSRAYKYNTQRINPATGAITTTKTNTAIGTRYYYAKNNITELDKDIDIATCKKPTFTFSENSCTIAEGAGKYYSFVPYKTNVISSSGAITGGGKYVLIHHGASEASPVSTLQLTTLSGGVTSTLNDWLEDDNNLIAGIFHSKSSSNIYAITFKKGTYSTDSPTWFDNCSTVWLFDFLTPKLFKTTTKLSEILNDLLI